MTESGPKTGVACRFPFKYKGTTYNECTMKAHHTFWCSTKTNSNGDHISGNYGHCNSNCNRTGCLTDETGLQEGVPCTFPFKVKGTTYNGCTREGGHIPWCSTKTDSNGDHNDGAWGNCNSDCKRAGCQTDDGDPCIFPFWAFGKGPFSGCTFEGRDVQWCSTKTDSYGNHLGGYWGKCNSDCKVDPGSTTRISFNGQHGVWGDLQFCGGKQSQGYAVRFKARIEKNQGDGDDTALNTICLICSGGDEICSKKGYWGDWYSSRTCDNGFTGFNFAYEWDPNEDSAQKVGAYWFFKPPADGSGGDDLQLKCKGKDWMGVSSPLSWGDWHSESCPSGYVICGLKTRVEPYIPELKKKDDTALNGVEFVCCEETAIKGSGCRTDSTSDIGQRGVPCTFPFIFKGVTYNQCTMEGHDKLWCSTKTNANLEYMNGSWGNCNSGCSTTSDI